MTETLALRAQNAGIEPSFRDYYGAQTDVSDETKRLLLEAMGQPDDAPATRALPPVVVSPAGRPVSISYAPPALASEVPSHWTLTAENGTMESGTLDDGCIRFDGTLAPGYYRVEVAQAQTTLIVVPERCYIPPAMESGREWALLTQLYALRSGRNWGIGDFTDLADFASMAGSAGASAVALNPLHELYPTNPPASSPYAPSSRLFLNVAYIDVESVPELNDCPGLRATIEAHQFASELRALRETEFVDYSGVWRAKSSILDALFGRFASWNLERPGDARASAFRRFVRDGGRPLMRLAVYEALAEHFRANDVHCYGWQQWPQAYRSPDSAEVAAFAKQRHDRVTFYLYLQWLADRQLAAAARTAATHGVGFYRDLAVGVDLNGADAWGNQHTIRCGASLGAPPDPLNALGQNWGLPPMSPAAMRERAYAPFIALLRANMRHAQFLRIDHVMALRRAFWIPRGHLPTHGAYVRYDFEELLGILALESCRNGCTVVGEDLGTVPEGFRERLHAAGVLSSRLVYFERDFHTGTFRAPSTYPRLAAASIGTHDLPPLAGWWIGDDIALRTHIGLYPSPESARNAADERRHARYVFVDALQAAGAIDDAGAARLRQDADRGGTLDVAGELALAAHRFLAQTPSMLAVVAIEDVLGEVDGVNVPGTVDQHPNWRRKRSLPMEDLARDGRLARIGAIMCDTQAKTLQQEAS